MNTKVTSNNLVVTTYNGVDYKYHRILDVITSMRLAYRVCMANIIHTQYWVPLKQVNVPAMIEKLQDTEIKDANPSFIKADPEKIKSFKNTGKYSAHVRSAHWYKNFIREGAIVNAFKIPEGKEKEDLIEAFNNYMSIIRKDVASGKYGKNTKVISYGEWLDTI